MYMPANWLHMRIARTFFLPIKEHITQRCAMGLEHWNTCPHWP